MLNIRKTFAKNPVFIGYLTAGDGGVEKTIAAACALIKGGVNLLEIGVPFSDPIADGPVIQRAMDRALKNGINLQDIFTIMHGIKQQYPDVPIVLFSYFNPLLAALHSPIFAQAKNNGVDAILIVDLPIEEETHYHQQIKNNGLAFIHVLSPSTPLERIKNIDRQNETFLYYACQKGTTGMRGQLPADFQQKIQQIKQNTTAPVAVGFGISAKETAKEVLKVADGFVVGSLFVKAIEDGVSPAELTALAKSVDPRSQRSF